MPSAENSSKVETSPETRKQLMTYADANNGVCDCTVRWVHTSPDPRRLLYPERHKRNLAASLRMPSTSDLYADVMLQPKEVSIMLNRPFAAYKICAT